MALLQSTLKKETGHWRNSHKRPMTGSGPEHVPDSDLSFSCHTTKPGAGSKIYSSLSVNAFGRIAWYVQDTPSPMPVPSQHSRVLRTSSRDSIRETAKAIVDSLWLKGNADYSLSNRFAGKETRISFPASPDSQASCCSSGRITGIRG